MKNEEEYVARTLNSVVSQTFLPVEWVIVNDGSTDRSVEIVSEYSRKFPWIRLVNSNGTRRSRGGHVVDLFYKGLEQLTTTEFEYLVKLDCDLSIAPDFFAVVLQTFVEHSKLGITSGISHIQVGGELVEEKSAPGHTLGATKIYRRSCFEDIGGLVRSMGWDGIDEIKARMLHWEAWPLRQLAVMHHRQEGKQLGTFASGLERGKGSYFMGYHPVFLLARVFRQLLRPGYFIDGIGILSGYFAALFRGEEKIPDVELVKYLRKHQIRKLLMLKSEV
jgi:poly-beta-1,6-N-acetyl-D-glucosamine synthase